jgi:hypothetical protein
MILREMMKRLKSLRRMTKKLTVTKNLSVMGGVEDILVDDGGNQCDEDLLFM